MTFLQKLQAHVGSLIKVNLTDFLLEDPLGGKIGMVCGATIGSAWSTSKNPCIKVSLFINGKFCEVFLYEEEVQFL